MTDNTLSNHFFDTVKRQPFYFGSREKPLSGWLHTVENKQYSDTGVIICPPLAVEYMNSYRALRYVADYFALAGIAAIRFDYHGTGNSSGIEEEEDRLTNWLWSIEQAIQQLKTLTGCRKFGLFGFRMGATLATLISEKIPSDFLILWAALNNGKNYIREIKLLQMAGETHTNTEALLEAGGMGYWPQTVEEISNINLSKVSPQARNILIIPRDEQVSDTKLYDHWKQKELNVSLETYIGSTEILIDPHLTVIPHSTIQNIVAWTTNRIKTGHTNTITQDRIHQAKTSSTFNYTSLVNKNQQNRIQESFFYFGHNNNRFGILTETPTSKDNNLPTVILSNSGANHHVGPSRLYVSIARELSLLGFRCLRIDIPGIGDSIVSNPKLENDEYISTASDEISSAIHSLDTDYKNKQYILMGLCSGAYFSFHAALDLANINIPEIILINPLTFYWDKNTSVHNSPTKEFSVWNWYKKAFSRKDSWIKLLKGEIDFASLFHAIKNRVAIKLDVKRHLLKQNPDEENTNRHQTNLGPDLTKITGNNTRIEFILAKSDPGYDILVTNAKRTIRKLQKNKNIGIHFINNADHTFSKYEPRCAVIHSLVQHFNAKKQR